MHGLQAFAAFEDKALSPDEEEKRHLAKCKMLGNIKFIGELGKLEILAESILHRCIQNLLARRAAAEHHEVSPRPRSSVRRSVHCALCTVHCDACLLVSAVLLYTLFED